MVLRRCPLAKLRIIAQFFVFSKEDAVRLSFERSEEGLPSDWIATYQVSTKSEVLTDSGCVGYSMTMMAH
jgi:hypothetical protein